MERELLRALLHCGYGDLEFLKNIWDKMRAYDLMDEHDFAEQVMETCEWFGACTNHLNHCIRACFDLIIKYIYDKYELSWISGSSADIFSCRINSINSTIYINPRILTRLESMQTTGIFIIESIQSEIWKFIE